MIENILCMEYDNCVRFLKFYLCVLFFFIVMSVVILVFVFILFVENCFGCCIYVVGILSLFVIVLFSVGLLILLRIVCGKRRYSNVIL